MIVCSLEDVEQQATLTPGLEKAIAFLRQAGLSEGPDGRREIDGDRVFALIQSYETVTGGEWVFEAHRRYLDVQYVASGDEVIGWAPLERLNITTAYDAARDVCLGVVAPEQAAPVVLAAGQLAILYPGDAHAPKHAAGRAGPVRKIVVKVALGG